jgi:hypothetical protein
LPNTPRLGLFYPLGTAIPSVHTYLQQLAEGLDGHAKDLAGTYAARPAASAAGRFYYAEDKGILYRDTGSAWQALHTVPLVTTWPPPAALAVDGMEIDYLTAALDLWKLKYRAADPTAYKWQVLSAPSIWVEVLTQESRTSATYGDLATVGPTITIPNNGDYIVEIGCNCFMNSTGGTTLWMSFTRGATAADDNHAIHHATLNGNLDDNDCHNSSNRAKRITGLTAGDTLVAKYRVSSDTGYWRWRWMRAQPIRIS